jgi:hypothetical protein
MACPGLYKDYLYPFTIIRIGCTHGNAEVSLFLSPPVHVAVPTTYNLVRSTLIIPAVWVNKIKTVNSEKCTLHDMVYISRTATYTLLIIPGHVEL